MCWEYVFVLIFFILEIKYIYKVQGTIIYHNDLLYTLQWTAVRQNIYVAQKWPQRKKLHSITHLFKFIFSGIAKTYIIHSVIREGLWGVFFFLSWDFFFRCRFLSTSYTYVIKKSIIYNIVFSFALLKRHLCLIGIILQALHFYCAVVLS